LVSLHLVIHFGWRLVNASPVAGSFHLVIPALTLALSPHQEAGARLYIILHEGECSISGCSPQAASGSFLCISTHLTALLCPRPCLTSRIRLVMRWNLNRENNVFWHFSNVTGNTAWLSGPIRKFGSEARGMGKKVTGRSAQGGSA
jgi:hypothetical protein